MPRAGRVHFASAMGGENWMPCARVGYHTGQERFCWGIFIRNQVNFVSSLVDFVRYWCLANGLTRCRFQRSLLSQQRAR